MKMFGTASPHEIHYNQILIVLQKKIQEQYIHGN